MARSAVPTDFGVPDVLPKETIGPEPYQRIQAPADAFGAGVAQGWEKLGQGALEASSFYGQVAAQDAANKWEGEANKILYGDPNVSGDRGFYGKEGRDALDAMPETVQRLTELRDRYKGGLTTRDMQQRFDERTFRVNHYYNEQIGRVYDREFKQYTSATNKATGDLALQNIGANPDDETLIEANRQRLRESYIKEAQNQYGSNLPPEIAQQALNRADREAVATRIRSLEDTDPPRALGLFNQNRSLLAALPQFPGWAHRLETRADQVGGEALADRVRAGGGGAPQQGDAGDRIAATLKARGWTPAAIEGALNNSITESSLNPGATGAAGEKGLFQFHPDSHIKPFTQAYGGNWSPEAQASYVADVVDKTMPGYAQSGDARQATAQFLRGFEKPKDQSDNQLNARLANSGASRTILGRAGPGEAATGAASPATPVAVGDSIAAHLIRFAGAEGKEDRTAVRSYRPGDTAVAGYTPSEILNQVIPAIPAEQIKGKPVLLSTGASNGPAQLDVIPQQIAALKERGAASVTLLGVGTDPSVTGVNDRLAQIAQENGAAFAGPLRKVASDGIHSGDNADLLRQARGAIPAAAGNDNRPLGRQARADGLDRQLSEIEADPNATPRQKEIAAARVTRDWQRERAATAAADRQEAAGVRQLIRDDEASLSATGQPVQGLDEDRVAAALGPEAANEFAANRQTMSRYFEQTHDFDTLPMNDIRGRLDQLRPAPGAPGYARAAKVYEAAEKRADAIDKLRATDPAQAVMTQPELRQLAQNATFSNPESYQPLARSRKIAMDQIGIPPENRVPITRREALTLWQPVGLAVRGGDPREIKSALTGTIETVQRAFGEDADGALEMVLREGHADRETSGQAASVLRRLARNEAVPPSAVRDVGTTAADAAARRVASPLAIEPGTATDPMTGLPMPGLPAQAPRASQPQKRYPAPDASAIEMLRRSPETATQFDAVYGPGTADKVLKIAPGRGTGP